MPPSIPVSQSDLKLSFIATLPLGIGMMAAIDEIIFHQILAWHHLFDWGTPAFSLLSDGLLHSGELIFFVLGFFMFADLRSRKRLDFTAAWAGFILGLGAFQLFDGIVDHKLLRLHQIRYVDNVWLYDLVWNALVCCSSSRAFSPIAARGRQRVLRREGSQWIR